LFSVIFNEVLDNNRKLGRIRSLFRIEQDFQQAPCGVHRGRLINILIF